MSSVYTGDMNHRLIIVAVLLAVLLVVVAGVTTAVVGRLASAERVYSVGEVVSGLRQHPQAWIGRTVLVRGAIIWYDSDHYGPSEEHDNEQDGCMYMRLSRSVPNCQRLMGLNIANVAPGSAVHAALASQFQGFRYVGGGLTPQHPLGTLSIRFHTPMTAAPNDPIPAILRTLPLIRSLFPAPPTLSSHGFILSGLFRLRLVAHRNHGQRQWYDDAIVLGVRP